MRQIVITVRATCDLCGSQETFMHAVDVREVRGHGNVLPLPSYWQRKWIKGNSTFSIHRLGHKIIGGREFDVCPKHEIREGVVVSHDGRSTSHIRLRQIHNGFIIEPIPYTGEEI